jgi:hypothetical protein
VVIGAEDVAKAHLIQQALDTDWSYAMTEFAGELEKTPSVRNTGIQQFRFSKATLDDLLDMVTLNEGESDVVSIKGRRMSLPEKHIKNELKRAIRQAYLPVKTHLAFRDISQLVEMERKRQHALAHDGDTDSFDKKLSANDFIALSVSYLGKASQKSFRNQRENQSYRENIIKTIALLYSALEHEHTALDQDDI